MLFYRYVVASCFGLSFVNASPHSHLHNLHRNAIGTYLEPRHGNDTVEPHQLTKRGLSDNVQLRIMCFGASIVNGYGSTDGNGFRYALRNKLVWEGNPVNMVGSVKAGTMADNDVEGWGGYVINTIAPKGELTYPSQPNIVLVYVGNNDMAQSIDVENAHNRLGALIDRIFVAVPGVTVIVGTLLPVRDWAANVKIYNSNLPGMVRSRQVAGKKLVLADMSSSLFSMSDISSDGLHPNDGGFRKMAAVWYQAIKAASDNGWITPPANVPGVSDQVIAGAGNKCDKRMGAAIGPYKIAQGSGWPDGDYVHASAVVEGYLGAGNPAPEGVHWADIDGDGVDDYVYVSGYLSQGLGVALSLPGGKQGPYLRVETGPEACPRIQVRFADMTGDGRADLCCISDIGDVKCWENKPGSDPRAPVWTSMGYLKQASGFARWQVRLADIDGDGRADYVGISEDGTQVWGWRNSAVRNGQPTRWIPFGGVAMGLQARSSNILGIRFVDLNGDSRADMVYVNENGQVTTWINQRGLSPGLMPVWIPFGVTHAGATVPTLVTFGKFMGTGRADYSVVTGNPATGNVWVAKYQNLGKGSTAVRGDGTRYCDMTGDGADDYIWISLMGEVTLYGNIHNWGSWQQFGVIINLNRSRREVYFADFDGDKKCDILLVDKATGLSTLYRNNYDGTKFIFTNMGVINAGSTCTAGYGSELRDLSVRWNDVDGDGRADFLCMYQDGTINGYFNKGINNMVWAGQMKKTELRERKSLRLADINGDGRDDLVWVDMRTSAAEVYYNEGVTGEIGNAAAGTSAIRWRYAGKMASGSSGRGTCIEFANIYGVGRADYILVYPVTNQQFAMMNVCADGGVAPVEPNLPSPPPMTYPLETASAPGSGRPDYVYDYSEETSIECTGTGYSSFEALMISNALGQPFINKGCAPIYTLQLLRTTLVDSVASYNKILEDDYDKKFGLYAEQMVLSGPSIVRDWYENNGNKHFNCIVAEAEQCCGSCKNYYNDQAGKKECKYCSEANCKVNFQHFEIVNHTEPCPPDVSQRGMPDPTIYWSLKSNTEEFWSTFFDATGVKQQFIRLGKDYRNERESGENPAPEEDGGWDIGVPLVQSSYKKTDVSNPKNMIADALKAVSGFPDAINRSIMMIQMGLYGGSAEDLVDAISVPILMIRQAVKAMEEIAKVGEKIEKEKEKQFLIMFFTAFLFLVPFLGEAVGLVAGMAAIGRAIALAGEIGSAGLGLYEVIDTKGNDPAAIIGLLLGVGAFAEIGQIGKAARLRRGMAQADLAKLGDGMVSDLSSIRTAMVSNRC